MQALRVVPEILYFDTFKDFNDQFQLGKGDILVKVLVNEQEKYLEGLTPVKDCYYRWSDLKAKIQNM